jgi:hypothetical protein
MKAQTILSTAIAFFVAIDASAQISITSQYNGYRDGDKMYRIVADHKSVGNRGENCMWELPPVRKDNNYVKQTIILKNDSLTIVEGDLMLHYIATDKGLSKRGFQKRDICSVQDKPLLELKYPFAYGDSIADTYSRKTTYFDTFTIEGEGNCYTVCDGRGVLTDGDETLKDVLRVHHHNTIISKYDNMDGDQAEPVVAEVTEDKYLWYYSGCRYPVMDTRIITSKSNGKTVSDSIFTSLYMPELQLSELAYDDANSQLVAQRDNREQSPGRSGSDNEDETSFPVTMSASLQANGGEISLDYHVAEDTDATFYAYDLAGRMLGCVGHASIGKGEYHETMALDRRPINGVVMLAMIAGEKKQVIKVS